MNKNNRADKAERALRNVKLYIRDAVKLMNADFSHSSQLTPLVGRIDARIIAWDKRTYSALVIVYDTKMLKYGINISGSLGFIDNRLGGTTELFFQPQYKWISLGSSYNLYKSDIWEVLNSAAMALRTILKI